jgi:hypothetical protein
MSPIRRTLHSFSQVDQVADDVHVVDMRPTELGVGADMPTPVAGGIRGRRREIMHL